MVPPPHPDTRWFFGLICVAAGVAYALWARQIRDWQIRSLQRDSYLIMTRLSGLGMIAIGLAILFGLGRK